LILPFRIYDTFVLEQRFGMDAYHPIDDELEAREAYALVGYTRKRERAIRIADVHRQLHGQRRKLRELDLSLLVAEPAFVDVTLVTLRARDRDRRSVGDFFGCRAAADDGGYAELARDEGGRSGRRGWSRWPQRAS